MGPCSAYKLTGRPVILQEHLTACGLDKAAAALQEEAHLPPASNGNAEPGPQSAAKDLKPFPSNATPAGFLVDLNQPDASGGIAGITRADAKLTKRSLSIAANVREPNSDQVPLFPPETDALGTPQRTPLCKRKATEPLSPPRKRLNTGDSRFGGARRTVSPEPDLPPGAVPASELKPHVYRTPTAVCPNPLPDQSAINPYYWQYANNTPNRTGTVPFTSDSQYLESAFTSERGGGNGNDPSTVTTTLDSIVTQYLKQQHRLCPAPITTLPPLSLHHNHVCPEPRRPLDAPANFSARLLARQWSPRFGGMGGRRQEKHMVYSR